MQNDACGFVVQNRPRSIKILSLTRIEGTPARGVQTLRAFYFSKSDAQNCALSIVVRNESMALTAPVG